MATHTDSDERVKKLFVGGLKRDTPDETLREYFEAFGELSDCVVIRDSQTKVSRGFGYVTFSSKDSVIEVLKVKKEKGVINIDGKDVEVKRAIPRDDNSSTAHVKTRKIFIGGIPDEATAEDIKQCISNEIRGEPVTVDLIMKKNEDGTKSTMHRGFCFVECEDEDIADELCCIKKVNIAGKDVEVKKAEPKDKGAQGGRGGRGGGGRGGYSGRGRGGGGGGDYGYGYQSGGGGGYQSYGGYSDPSYGYGGSYDPYGNGSYGSYGAMGMGYQQASSNYGPQSYQGRGGGRGRYQPY